MDKNLHPLDEFFRKGIEGHREEPEDSVWGFIDRNLDKRALFDTQRKYRYLKRAVAALLILTASVAVGLWISYSKKEMELTPSASVIVKENPIANKSIEKNIAGKLSKIDVKSTSSKEKINAFPNDNYPIKSAANAKGIDKIKENEFTKNQTALKKQEKSFLSNSTNEKVKILAARNNSTIILKKSENAVKEVGQSSSWKTKFNEARLQSKDEYFVENAPRVGAFRVVLPRLQGISQTSDRKLMPSEKASNTINSTVASKSKRPKKISFAVSPFIMPEHTRFNLQEGRTEHHEDQRDIIEQGETVKASQSYGTNIYVDFGGKFSLLSGLTVSSTSSTILPRSIYARPHRERPGQPPSQESKYKINCASGYAYVNTKTGTSMPNSGDSIQGLTSTSRLKHLVVPLGVRYIVETGRVGIGVVGGVNFNLLSSANLDVNFTEPAGQKEQVTAPIEGLKSMYLSGFMGISLQYTITKRFSLQLTPIHTLGISSLNKNTPASSKKTTTGAQFGLRVNL